MTQSIRTSPSDMGTFLECRRKWALSQEYEKNEQKDVLILGQLIHLYLEWYYKQGGRIPGVPAETRFDEIKDTVLPILHKIWEEDVRPKVGPEFGSQFGQLVLQSQEVFRNYLDFDPYPRYGWTLLDVEKKVEIDVDGHTFVGKIDLLFQDNLGAIHIVDHKTKKSIGRVDGLEVDLQMTAYSWLVYKTYGKVPASIEYNLILQTPPQNPSQISGTSTQPVRFSKSKDQPTTGRLYRQSLQQAGLSERDYQEILFYFDSKGPEVFNQQVSTYRNKQEVLSFELMIRQILPQMTESLYPSPSTMGCTWCPYLQVCKSMNDGSDWRSVLESPGFRKVEPRKKTN